MRPLIFALAIILSLACGAAARGHSFAEGDEPCQEFKAIIIKPAQDVDYKIGIITPSREIDYKIGIINPCATSRLVSVPPVIVPRVNVNSFFNITPFQIPGQTIKQTPAADFSINAGVQPPLRQK
jgi:hypothetical protein